MGNYILLPEGAELIRQILHAVPRGETYLHNIGTAECTCNCVPLVEAYYNCKILLVIHNTINPNSQPVSEYEKTYFRNLYLLNEEARCNLIEWDNRLH